MPSLMEKIDSLLRKGVKITDPAGVEIGTEVDAGRIAGEGVVIHPGCRIRGERTLILAGAKLGAEAPATVENCRVGPGVELKGGFFREAVFLEKACCGLGSHVREGTILEEGASIAHTVGLKQTILFPFVTLGSLINFCDCLMAGGTDRKNHSEVGSSYIHFNFTPNQDKATPSMIGDVPRGVMLNQRPIFLGGQGGMVGRLIIGGAGKGGSIEFRPGRFSGTARIIKNNLVYIANLMALRHWYREVRSLFVGVRFPEPLLAGLTMNAQRAVDERTKRLKELGDKMAASGDPSLLERWPSVEQALAARNEHRGNDRLRESFQEKTSRAIESAGKDYIAVIKGLTAEESEPGTAWLQGIVDETVEVALAALK